MEEWGALRQGGKERGEQEVVLSPPRGRVGGDRVCWGVEVRERGGGGGGGGGIYSESYT